MGQEFNSIRRAQPSVTSFQTASRWVRLGPLRPISLRLQRSFKDAPEGWALAKLLNSCYNSRIQINVGRRKTADCTTERVNTYG
jgi:hypothetical protein